MHIDELISMIDADVGVPLRRDMVEWEASRTPVLHQKYRKMLYREKLELERMKSGIKPLVRAKTEYYTGRASPDIYKEKPFDLKLKTTKGEVAPYLESDEDLVAANDLIIQQAEKVSYLVDVLNDIRTRSYLLSNILNSQKFKAGMEKLGMGIDISDPDHDD